MNHDSWLIDCFCSTSTLYTPQTSDRIEPSQSQVQSPFLQSFCNLFHFYLRYLFTCCKRESDSPRSFSQKNSAKLISVDFVKSSWTLNSAYFDVSSDVIVHQILLNLWFHLPADTRCDIFISFSIPVFGFVELEANYDVCINESCHPVSYTHLTLPTIYSV